MSTGTRAIEGPTRSEADNDLLMSPKQAVHSAGQKQCEVGIGAEGSIADEDVARPELGMQPEQRYACRAFAAGQPEP